jgi:hypothetical protein
MASCDNPVPPAVVAFAGCYAFARADGRPEPLGRAMPDTLHFDTSPSGGLRRRSGRGYPDKSFPWPGDVLSRRPDALAKPVATNYDTTWLRPPWTWEYRYLAWRLVRPDSFVVVLSPSRPWGAGWELQLRVAGDSLVGRAEPRSDVRFDPRGTVKIVGRRTPCRRRSESDVLPPDGARPLTGRPARD